MRCSRSPGYILCHKDTRTKKGHSDILHGVGEFICPNALTRSHSGSAVSAPPRQAIWFRDFLQDHPFVYPFTRVSSIVTVNVNSVPSTHGNGDPSCRLVLWPCRGGVDSEVRAFSAAGGVVRRYLVTCKPTQNRHVGSERGGGVQDRPLDRRREKTTNCLTLY